MEKRTNKEEAHIDIEALIEYIKQLTELHRLLDENFKDAHKSIKSAPNYWKDDLFKEFEEAFDETYPKIKTISEFSQNAARKMTKDWLPDIQEYIAIKKGIKK